ncbi:MAG: hypothetical protein R2867_14525 [Caldilineaceae bacterium]
MSAELRRRDHPVRILILTALSDGESIQAAGHQADGFVLKTDPPLQNHRSDPPSGTGHLVFPRAARRWMTNAPKKGPSSLRVKKMSSPRFPRPWPAQRRDRHRVEGQREYQAFSSEEYLVKSWT